MSTVKIVAIGVCVFIVLTFIVLLSTFSSEKRMSYEACTKAGGVAVKAYMPGPQGRTDVLVCVAPSAVIKP